MSEKMRLFVGVPIPEAIRDRVRGLRWKLSHTGARVKWVEPENLHVTLVFLGEVAGEDEGLLTELLTATITKEPAFELNLLGLGAFPNRHRPKTLWVGIEQGASELQRLHAELASQLESAGLYRAEERPYTPHLTLGRVRTDQDSLLLTKPLDQEREWSAGSMKVTETNLYESQLSSTGPTYTVRASATLACPSTCPRSSIG